MSLRVRKSTGFSLVELVVVIVIIGILAAIAVPRLSRGASGASQSALSADLATIRNAINLYFLEHANKYPEQNKLPDQLTKATAADGAVSPTGAKDSTYRFGPYLAAIPPVPVGAAAITDKANQIKYDTTTPLAPILGGGEGWIYNYNSGEFMANTDQKDDAGKDYKSY